MAESLGARKLDDPAYELRQWFDFFEAKAIEYYAAGQGDEQRLERMRNIKGHIETLARDAFGAPPDQCKPPACWDGTRCVPCEGILKKLWASIAAEGQKES